MLRESLKPFFVSLSQEEKLQALRAVSYFILTNDYREYRERVRALPSDVQDSFYKEVRNLVKSSFECRKVWRAVRSGLQSGDSIQAVARKYEADVNDVTLIWGCLSKEDKESIETLSKNDKYTFLNTKDFETLVVSLDKFCGKVAYLKLRFLADNDRSLDLQDLRSELLAHGIQVVRIYEHTDDLKMIENYAKASIQNHAINLIQHFTSESRACVRNATVGCGTCIFCLTDKPQRCPQAVADYHLTTLSMEGLALAALGQTRRGADDRVITAGFLDTLKEDAPPGIEKVVNLVFGAEVDDQFEAWLKEQHEITVDELSDSPKRLVKLLCQYLQLPTKQVNDHLKVKYHAYMAEAV